MPIPLPPINVSTSSPSRADSSGTIGTPWYQGDFVVSYAGEAASGARTSPLGGGFTPRQLAIGAGVLLIGFLLWRRFK